MTKYILGLLFIGLAAFFFWPVEQDSGIYKTRQSILNKATLIGKSEDECKQELEMKRANLEAYEKALDHCDAEFERMNAEIPVCPRTGQKSELRIIDDPRPDLRVKIQALEEEIKVLESKFSGT